MEEILGEVTKGFFRGIGYILAEVFFWTICYWVGWPICKIVTLGSYPRKSDSLFLDDRHSSQVWCGVVGLVSIVGLGVFYLTYMTS